MATVPVPPVSIGDKEDSALKTRVKGAGHKGNNGKNKEGISDARRDNWSWPVIRVRIGLALDLFLILNNLVRAWGLNGSTPRP